MGTLEFNSKKHWVRDTEVARYFQQQLKTDNVVTFWNDETGQWVLGTWINKDKGLMGEIDDLGPNFEMVTREFANSIGRVYTRDVLRVARQRLIDQWKRQKAREEEKSFDHTDKFEFMRKRNRDRSVSPLVFY